MKTPEQIAERNGWDGYNSIVDLRDIADIQKDSWNEALDCAIGVLKRDIKGLDCDCEVCRIHREHIASLRQLKKP